MQPRRYNIEIPRGIETRALRSLTDNGTSPNNKALYSLAGNALYNLNNSTLSNRPDKDLSTIAIYNFYLGASRSTFTLYTTNLDTITPVKK